MPVEMYGTMWVGGSGVYECHFLRKMPKKFGAGSGKGLKKIMITRGGNRIN
jgi:hypothetical protein